MPVNQRECALRPQAKVVDEILANRRSVLTIDWCLAYLAPDCESRLLVERVRQIVRITQLQLFAAEHRRGLQRFKAGARYSRTGRHNFLNFVNYFVGTAHLLRVTAGGQYQAR